MLSGYNLSFFDEHMARTKRDKSMKHVVGYARLSYDEDGTGYCSILNQRNLIEDLYKTSFADENSTFTFIMDDGVSGYKFDRPGFMRVLELIENGKCDVLLAKDLSRIGRHSALTQLFIEQCERANISIIAMDDYRSGRESDDLLLGIKAWSNERAVKDASAKVLKVVSKKQKDGEYLCAVPFGYIVKDYKKRIVEIDEDTAPTVQKIYDLYLSGNGIRAISDKLNAEHVKTASQRAREMAIARGDDYRKKVSDMWTATRIKEILENDFYIGTLRTGKYRRNGINGKDVKTDTSYVFENHHPAIISKTLFAHVRERYAENKNKNYRHKGGVEHPFHGLLRCKDCGKLLYCYSRPNLKTQYVCSTHFKYGKAYCERHMIKEETLIAIAIDYLKIIRATSKDALEHISVNKQKNTVGVAKELDNTRAKLSDAKSQLEVIETQRVKQIIAHPEREQSINEIYDSMHTKTEDEIKQLSNQIMLLESVAEESRQAVKQIKTALDVVDAVIEQGTITHNQAVAIFDHIIVDKNGNAEVFLKSYLSFVEDNMLSEGDPLRTIFIQCVVIASGIKKLESNMRKVYK